MNEQPNQKPLSQAAIHLNPRDNVAIAKWVLEPGTRLSFQVGEILPILVLDQIPPGHKVSLVEMGTGDPIIRYGEVIGTASQEIQVGSHVHTHNVEPAAHDRAFDLDESRFNGGNLKSVGAQRQVSSTGTPRSFEGYLRQDGRVGTRNYIALIASVQCASQVCHRIAQHFTSERLAAYPNVDGVIALTHNGGCAQPDYSLLQRTLTGMANHPNVAGVVYVGLGCEGNQLGDILEVHKGFQLEVVDQPSVLEIQALGGSGKTIQAGIDAVEAILPRANSIHRSPQPLSKLTLALECGGSDSWSGITANPLVGLASDALVMQGGTVVMAETPETFGAQHLLLRRADNAKVVKAFTAKLDWWQDYVARVGASLEDNPGPGNQAGGLTNICEKSLGAIAKSGTTPLMAVYDYAENIRQTGFVFMDSPGYDQVSVTGMVAGGCNLVLFTTGRGSVFGFKPAPSLKISTNSTTYNRMIDDMDFNAGRILEENVTMEALAAELLDMVILTASGEPTKSEGLGLGELEFAPWNYEGLV
jgi:altronate dehydratase